MIDVTGYHGCQLSCHELGGSFAPATVGMMVSVPLYVSLSMCHTSRSSRECLMQICRQYFYESRLFCSLFCRIPSLLQGSFVKEQNIAVNIFMNHVSFIEYLVQLHWQYVRHPVSPMENLLLFRLQYVMHHISFLQYPI